MPAAERELIAPRSGISSARSSKTTDGKRKGTSRRNEGLERPSFKGENPNGSLFCEANQDYCEFMPKRGVRATKNGGPCATLLPVTEETELETLALAHNEQFWRMFDAAIARGAN
jgi:hypothetical protein